MRVFILPLGRLCRSLREGAVRILGREETESLENEIYTPVADFVEEVLDDTVGDVMRRMEDRRSGRGQREAEAGRTPGLPWDPGAGGRPCTAGHSVRRADTIRRKEKSDVCTRMSGGRDGDRKQP